MEPASTKVGKELGFGWPCWEMETRAVGVGQQQDGLEALFCRNFPGKWDLEGAEMGQGLCSWDSEGSLVLWKPTGAIVAA